MSLNPQFISLFSNEHRGCFQLLLITYQLWFVRNSEAPFSNGPALASQSPWASAAISLLGLVRREGRVGAQRCGFKLHFHL